MSGRRVLVVGSYPPIPLPAAAATVEAVRRAWAAGDEVTVVSPRLSAAPLAVPVAGVLAGHRLAHLRQFTGASRAVLVMERGFPLRATSGGGPVTGLVQWQTVRLLARAFAGFEQVTLVRSGALDVPPRIESALVRAAAEVIDYPGDPAAGQPGVTALGPAETLPRERPRQIAGLIGRRLLGRHAGAVRARVRAAVRR